MYKKDEVLKLVELLPYGSFPLQGLTQEPEVDLPGLDSELQNLLSTVSRYGSLTHNS